MLRTFTAFLAVACPFPSSRFQAQLSFLLGRVDDDVQKDGFFVGHTP